MTAHRSNYALRVGLLVAFGCLLFVFAIFFVGKQQNLFGSSKTIKTIFSNVGGLQVGNNVRFNGINIGTVSDIFMLTDTTVMVLMTIESDKSPFIKTSSQTTIGTEGLMGDKVIVISSGDERSPSVKDNDVLKSQAPIELDAILGSLQSTVANTEIISSELAMIMYKVNNGNGVLSRMLVDSSLADNFSNTMENLEQSSKSLDENLSAAKQSFILRGAYRKIKKDEDKAQEEKNNKKEPEKNGKKNKGNKE